MRRLVASRLLVALLGSWPELLEVSLVASILALNPGHPYGAHLSASDHSNLPESPLGAVRLPPPALSETSTDASSLAYWALC